MVLRDIHSPADLKKIPVDQLAPIADQLRDYIIDTLSSHPGHLASSLGTVELTIALHYVFNAPDDKLVWDVGHQAYAHKILTGRGERFSTIRTYGGLSGFPKMSESEYDAFGTGHSSTSISAALGMATASKLQGNTTRNRRYNKLKKQVWQRLDGDEGDRRHATTIGLLQRLTSMAKTVAVGGSNLFEALGIRYFGPVDGHNINDLIDILKRLRDIDGPKLLHVVTKKGKGLRQAEQDPVVYHAPGLYDIRTGNQIKAEDVDKPLKYQEVFGRTIIELAKKNPAIVGITPAMATGCSLNMMMEEMPERVFDVGIAEQHAVTFSAGLAAAGMVPFCNIYSSFAQRAYDQIIHDVALQKLPVIICLDRAGLVGDDGPTHHGTFDLAYLRPVPNLTICAPMNEHELRNMMYTAQIPGHGPVVIRYPRGASVHSDWRSDFCEIRVGEGRLLQQGNDVAIISLGHPGNDAVSAAEELEKQGISTAVYDMRFLKPLDTKLLDEIAAKGYRRIITVEDGCRIGGFGEAVTEYYAEKHPETVRSITILAIPDEFVTHGSVARLKADCRIDKAAIIEAATK